MFRLVLRSLVYYWRAHLGVLLGTVLATAVLTGALLVGDSVDYSLQAFAATRLGGVHFAAETRGKYFSDELAPALVRESNTQVAAVLRLPGIAIAQRPGAGDGAQVNQVQVLGVDADFWTFTEGLAFDMAERETAINAKLAAELDIQAGDEIALRVSKPAFMARDAPLAQRQDDVFERARYTVKRILSDEELGRFSLSASQVPPYNAFVSRSWLQEHVDLPARANVLLVGDEITQSQLEDNLKKAWKPADIGLEFRTYSGGLVQLQTDRVFFDPESARAALAIPDARGTLTYLVNSFRNGDELTPYSFVVAGPVPEGLDDSEIIINRWLADEIDADTGDEIEMAYFQLLPSNKFVEHTRSFTVAAIRDMDALSLEKELMPDFPGLSDVERCADWDVGMPMDEELLNDEANEAYWEEYRQTPKAFITLAAGQEMWANRFGNLTAVRYAGNAENVEQLRAALTREIDPSRAGLTFINVKEQAASAVNQSMDFGGLFIGLSFFLIVAALLLMSLLHVFGLQQRTREMGALLAMGYRHRHVRGLLMTESLATALAGAVIGAALGSLYCQALISGLARFWQGAVAGAAIQYHGSIQTITLGGGISFVCAFLAMSLTLWRQSRYSAHTLLQADFSQDRAAHGLRRPSRLVAVLSWLGLLLSALIVAYTLFAESADASLSFFAAGLISLLSGLGIFRYFLARDVERASTQGLSLQALALKNLARRSGRSLVVAGLLASGCFLVFAVSSMQEDFSKEASHRSSGTGGFALYADSTFPLLENPAVALNEPGISGTALKVRDGDDASCLNLNHAQTPRLLGVNVDDMKSRNAFTGETADDSVWRLLDRDFDDGTIPALVGDANTAMWTLKKSVGVEDGDLLEYKDEFGNDVKIRLVGTLPMRLSVFQGAILIADEAFTRLFPSEEGYRMFLIDAPEGKVTDVESSLQKKYGRFGFEAMPAIERLKQFYAVESTYLAMFLVLGGLGLVVGSLGMGIVVLRNILERRSELALLRAIGFGSGPVYYLLIVEYGTLLAAGLGIGCVAAAVAILPVFWTSQSHAAIDSQLGMLALVAASSGVCTACAILFGVKMNDPAALRNE